MILHLTWVEDCHSQQQKRMSGEDEMFSVFKTTLKDAGAPKEM